MNLLIKSTTGVEEPELEKVLGELYEIDRETLARLDAREGNGSKNARIPTTKSPCIAAKTWASRMQRPEGYMVLPERLG
jgi:gamma-glutamylcyclotransferase (GGCT)/AIG2-like uncharacterized protein YtfP